MRNRALHAALRNFALEAAALLTDDLRAGAELEFDVIDERTRRGPSLYHYSPRIGEFLQARWPRLRSLPSRPAAAEALGTGAAAYLRMNGLPGAQAEPALQAMLERLYEDATSFGFPEERFERVYTEVEDTLYEDALRTTVVATLRGVQIEAPRVDLGGGVWLARADAPDVPPEARQGEDPPGCFCIFERYVASDDHSIELEARMRFARLVTGLRLWDCGGVELSPLAWRRAAEGRWQALVVDASGTRGEPWTLMASEGPALREFLETVDGTPRARAVDWALTRFELGCSRPREVEALSDYLLALHALLHERGDGNADTSTLPLRLAALCAEEGQRPALQQRVEQAVALERFLMGGGPEPEASGEELGDLIGSESPRELVQELERHLRALLRDVLCGYLEPDLGAIADDILLGVPDPDDIEVRDLRLEGNEHDTEEVEALPQMALRDALMERMGRFDRASEPDLRSEAAPEGVTASVDWDEDPHSYSAPV